MKKIMLCLLAVVFLTSFAFSADSIKFKNGKVFSGIILDYANGYYSFKMNGKKFSVPEASVAQIYWRATQAELDAAILSEPASAAKK